MKNKQICRAYGRHQVPIKRYSLSLFKLVALIQNDVHKKSVDAIYGQRGWVSFKEISVCKFGQLGGEMAGYLSAGHKPGDLRQRNACGSMGHKKSLDAIYSVAI